ncbi:MAG: hypothetical protein M0C28_18395 [Candidatus Moduliflexus flocculans]|nr:hypothetical protein [Candidatus Moduliflexus flocculans]
MKIPFRVLEGKYVSRIAIERLIVRTQRLPLRLQAVRRGDGDRRVHPLQRDDQAQQRHHQPDHAARQPTSSCPRRSTPSPRSSSIMSITSLLGVKVKGVSQLYFTNPEQVEMVGSNTYRINSATFTLTELPQVTHYLS